MALGPGKYDEECTLVRKRTNAKGAIVIIVEGDKGEDFSVQAPLRIQMLLPQMLRNMADSIEESFKEGRL